MLWCQVITYFGSKYRQEKATTAFNNATIQNITFLTVHVAIYICFHAGKLLSSMLYSNELMLQCCSCIRSSHYGLIHYGKLLSIICCAAMNQCCSVAHACNAIINIQLRKCHLSKYILQPYLKINYTIYVS